MLTCPELYPCGICRMFLGKNCPLWPNGVASEISREEQIDKILDGTYVSPPKPPSVDPRVTQLELDVKALGSRLESFERHYGVYRKEELNDTRRFA